MPQYNTINTPRAQRVDKRGRYSYEELTRGDKPSTFQVTQMWDLHKEITRRLLVGQKEVDIATDLGITPQTVSYTRNSPIVKRQLELMHGARDANSIDFAKELQVTAGKAVVLLRDVLEDEKHPISLRVKVAMDAVDRHIPKVQINKNFNAHYTVEDIEELKRRAQEEARNASMIIDAEVIECNG